MGWRSTICGFVVLVIIAYLLQRDSFQAESVHGKRVVITGASAGIGEELAYQYSRLGANILITSRRDQVLRKVVAKCLALGAQSAHYIALDMGKPGDPELLIEEANTVLQGLDHLILNHVTYDHMGFWDGDMEQLRRVMRINFESYVSAATAAIPLLEASGGSIGVVSSGAGILGNPFTVSYGTAKHALNGFFNSLRQEFVLADNGISITVCILGSIKTPNSIEAAGKFFKAEIKTGDAVDTAYAIMSGVTQRYRDVYHPWLMLKMCAMFRDWFPNTVDYLVRLSVKED